MVFGSVLKSVLYKNNFQNPSTFKIFTIGPLILDKQKCNPPSQLFIQKMGPNRENFEGT